MVVCPAGRHSAPDQTRAHGRRHPPRPIAIGEAARGAITSAALQQCWMAPLVDYLAPQQLAVGVPAGASSLIHGARLSTMLRRRFVLISLDMTDAYQHVWRSVVLQRMGAGVRPLGSAAWRASSTPFTGRGRISTLELRCGGCLRARRVVPTVTGTRVRACSRVGPTVPRLSAWASTRRCVSLTLPWCRPMAVGAILHGRWLCTW